MRSTLLVVVAVAAARPSTPRTVAHGVVQRCTHGGAFADRALSSALRDASLEPRDAALATELVYGVLRNCKLLDYQLSQLASLRKADAQTLTSLRIAAYELTHCRTPEYAAVNEAVAAEGRKHIKRFLNGVLRNFVRRRDELRAPEDDPALQPIEALAVRCSLPRWLLGELVDSSALPSVDALGEWARANQKPPQLSIRVNQLRASAPAVADALRDAGLSVSRAAPAACGEGEGEAHEALANSLVVEGGGGDVAKMAGFERGDWTVQDFGAQLVGALASPTRGETVLDLCAAPGGKTTHLAELMGGEGRVVSVEVRERKVALIADACERLGLGECVTPVCADATDADGLRALLREHAGRELADRVVLDAPCSGYGTLRRNPEIRMRGEEEDVERVRGLQALQDRLLDAAAQCVEVGGTVTYAVCTPRVAEGEERIAAFLERQRGAFALVPVDEEALRPFASNYRDLGERACLRTWTHTHGCDSFFAAKVRRLN